MNGDFELNTVGYYTPILVEENAWLNDKQSPADLQKYGRNYAVVFEGDAATYLWTAKNAPEVGKRYWGHLQATSGKSIRFKTDKQEDGPTNAASPQSQPQGSYEGHSDKEDSIARAVALKAAVEYLGPDDGRNDVLKWADKFLAWLQNSGAQPVETQGTQAPRVQQEATSAAPAAVSGYDQARQGRNRLAGEPLPEPPENIPELNPGDYYED